MFNLGQQQFKNGANSKWQLNLKRRQDVWRGATLSGTKRN